MRGVLILFLTLTYAASPEASQQTKSAQKPTPATKSTKAPKTITLTGCVERDEKAADQFTLTDTKDHQAYRLTGLDLREYLNRPVQIDGGVVVKGIKVSGGLLPNPNVAAQAGALDPSRAAVAGATGIGPTGTVTDIQEFRVKAIRTGTGSCP